MATVDCLVDYKMGNTINTISKSKTYGRRKSKVKGKLSFTKKASWKGTTKGVA